MNAKIAVLVFAFLVFLSAHAADAQQPAKVFRIGILSPRTGPEPRDEVFRQRLRELGYIEGQNLVIEWRFWEGKPDRLNEYAAELVRLKVDVIFGNNTATIEAARKATTTIPIVMTAASDPAESGLVASLERPGGNITGLTSASYALIPKRFELLKEIIPGVSRVGVLLDPSYLPGLRSFKEVEKAAVSLGLSLQSLEVRSAGDFEEAFRAAINSGAQALIQRDHPIIGNERKRITAPVLKNRLPALYTNTEFIDAGGMMSYGADPLDITRRAAEYVNKIIKGAKPADMPIGQATKFELVINASVARQIGLTLPPNVLARPDKVIR